MMSCARAGFPCHEQHVDAAESAGWLGGVERSTWNLFALGCVLGCVFAWVLWTFI